MRRNWNANYRSPYEATTAGMLAVGLGFIIGFIAIMMEDIKGFDAKELKIGRWIGVGLGAAFFVVVWGLAILYGRTAPNANTDFVIGFIVIMDIAWVIFTINRGKIASYIRSKRDNNADRDRKSGSKSSK